MNSLSEVTVIGGGSWATAIVKMLSSPEKALKVHWWLRNPEDVAYINSHAHNPKYLSDVTIDLNKVHLYSDINMAVSASELVVLAIPSAFFSECFAKIDTTSLAGKYFLSAIKGVVPETHQIVSHYLETSFNVPSDHIAAITGPCHAEEVALEKLSFLTFASSDESLSDMIAGIFKGRYINTKTTTDMYGVEYSAVLKNVYAIASGICHGLGYGDNYQAVLVSSAIRETERFLDAHHELHRDVKENAYLGDLLVTAYSQFSRNRTFGTMLGKGYSVKSAQLEMNMVAEGFYATQTMHDINKDTAADMPILEAVYDIIYRGMHPRLRMGRLSESLN